MWRPVARPDHDRWREHAACRNSDASLFFPSGSTGAAIDQIEAAKAVCAACPVRDDCLRFAVETNQEDGVWGGRDEIERRRVWREGQPPGETLGDGVRLDVGPVAPASAVAWLGWADEVYCDLDNRPASARLASTGLSVDVVSYLHRWIAHAGAADKIYRWQADVDPDELEYLVHAFCSLDAQTSAEGVLGEQLPVPEEGRAFYLVLVGALLHALETESLSRAAFVDQLRSYWPSAAEAN